MQARTRNVIKTHMPFVGNGMGRKRSTVRQRLLACPARASSVSVSGLEQWLNKEGVKLESLEIRDMPGTGGRGLFSRRKIKRGETCVMVPDNLAVTMQTVLEHPLLGPIITEHSIPEWAALAMWLVYTTHETLLATQGDAEVSSASKRSLSEGKDLVSTKSISTSPWGPYVLELPIKAGTLMEWPESTFSDASLLGGATIASIARQQRREFDQLISAILATTSRQARDAHPAGAPGTVGGTGSDSEPVRASSSNARNTEGNRSGGAAGAASPGEQGTRRDSSGVGGSINLDEVFNQRRLEWAFSMLLSRLVRLNQAPGSAGSDKNSPRNSAWGSRGGSRGGGEAGTAYAATVTAATVNAATRMALVPYADLLNHAVGSAAYLTWAPARGGAGGKGAVVMVADRDYEAGEQVFISYGPLSSGQLLLAYGFVPPLGANPHDEAWLLLRVADGDPLRQAKVQLLERIWGPESDGCRHHEQRFPLRQNEIPGQLMGFARLAASTADTLVHFTSCANDPSTLAARLQAGAPSRFPALELAARQLAVQAIKAALAAYTSPMAQDEQWAAALSGETTVPSVPLLVDSQAKSVQAADGKASKRRRGGQSPGSKRAQPPRDVMQPPGRGQLPGSTTGHESNTMGSHHGRSMWGGAAGSHAEDLAELAMKASVVCVAERRILLRVETILRKEMRDIREGKQLSGSQLDLTTGTKSVAVGEGAKSSSVQGGGILGSVLRIFAGPK